MATIDIQDLRKLISETPLKDMELDAKHYAVLSVHGEVLADCPNIHYARYFSQVSPRLLSDLLDRLEAAEKAVTPTHQRYLVAMTMESTDDTVYYVGPGVSEDDSESFYDWDTNPSSALVFIDQEQAYKHMVALEKISDVKGTFFVHHYNPS